MIGEVRLLAWIHEEMTMAYEECVAARRVSGDGRFDLLYKGKQEELQRLRNKVNEGAFG